MKQAIQRNYSVVFKGHRHQSNMDKCMFYTVSDCNSQHTWEDQICRNFVAREAHGLDSISPTLLLHSCVFRIWVINPEMNHVPTHRFIALLDTSRELLFMHEHELERERDMRWKAGVYADWYWIWYLDWSQLESCITKYQVASSAIKRLHLWSFELHGEVFELYDKVCGDVC